MNTMTTDNFLKEYASILTGEHPGYKGDRYVNAEYFMYKTCGDIPKEFMNIIQELKDNPTTASEISGLHINRIAGIVAYGESLISNSIFYP